MEPFHPLANDSDVPAEEIAAAEARCALALGRLDGLLNGLSADENRLFCWALLRSTLLAALTQAGYADAELRFNKWSVGIDRGPDETPLAACSPRAIVRSILAELGNHSWEPLAETARQAHIMGRFASDRQDSTDIDFAVASIDRARKLGLQAVVRDDGPLPFSALSKLTNLAQQDAQFAPLERETRMLAIGGRDVVFERAAQRTPLWALDVVLGQLLRSSEVWPIALPCPGTVVPQLMAANLWPGERKVAIAGAVESMTSRLIQNVKAAKRRGSAMNGALSHLRSNSRAPGVWMAAIGFAPLGLEQVSAAFDVSRRGIYTIVDSLIAARLMMRGTIDGMVLLTGIEPPESGALSDLHGAAALPSPALVEFQEAMANIDRLLAGKPGSVHQN